MARSSATRTGNGGWGGPAKGAGNRGGAIAGGRPKGVKTGDGKKSVADLMAADEGRRVAAEAWMAILRDPTHPKHADMVAKAADRMDGAPSQDLTSGGEKLPTFTIVTGVPRSSDEG